MTEKELANHPQGPKGKPSEELQRFVELPFSYLNNCYQQYGSIFQLPFNIFQSPFQDEEKFSPTVILSHPEALGILNHPSTLKSLENQKILTTSCEGVEDLLSLNKTAHQRLRKLMMPHLHGKALQAQASHYWSIAEQLSQGWADTKPFKVLETMKVLTLEVIVQIVFGMLEGECYEGLKYWLVEWLDWIHSPEIGQAIFQKHLQQDEGPKSPWGKHLHNLKKIDEILYAEIHSRRTQQEETPKSILSLLLLAEDEQGNKLTDTEVRDNLMLMVVGSRDNTAAAIAWALYELHNHPEVLNKLRQELYELGKEPEPLDVYSAPYLSAVCKEVLRIYAGGLISLPRILTAPLELMGYSLPAETVLCGSYYLLHRNPELYPEPEKFKPERFLERDYGSSEWMPFGGGHRSCIGYALAMMELKLALVVFLSHYKFKRTGSQPIGMMMKGLNIHPDADFQLQVIN